MFVSRHNAAGRLVAFSSSYLSCLLLYLGRASSVLFRYLMFTSGLLSGWTSFFFDIPFRPMLWSGPIYAPFDCAHCFLSVVSGVCKALLFFVRSKAQRVQQLHPGTRLMLNWLVMVENQCIIDVGPVYTYRWGRGKREMKKAGVRYIYLYGYGWFV